MSLRNGDLKRRRKGWRNKKKEEEEKSLRRWSWEKCQDAFIIFFYLALKKPRNRDISLIFSIRGFVLKLHQN